MKRTGKNSRLIIKASFIFLVLVVMNERINAQQKQLVRLVKIHVDPIQLKEYNAALKESIEISVKLDPGVLTYYAVADKADPASITILEIYADEASYKAHIETTHFKKYKTITKNMVKSLELIDVDLLTMAKKQGS